MTMLLYEKEIAMDAREEGRKEGIEKGIEKGIEQGMEQGKMETAQNMLLGNMNISIIAEMTKLSKEKIEVYNVPYKVDTAS